MIKNSLLKKALLSSVGGAITIAPLALAASCGESTSNANPAVDIKNQINQTIAKILVKPDSTNDFVKWEALPNDTAITGYKFYYSTETQSVAQIKDLKEDAWSDKLPTKIDFIHKNRHLWVKLSLAPNVQLDEKIVEITSTTKIPAVKSKIDADTEFQNYTYSPSIVIAQDGTVSFNEPNKAPRGTMLAYDYASIHIGTSYAEFNAYLKTKPSKTEMGKVKIYLKNLDENLYILENIKNLSISLIS